VSQEKMQMRKQRQRTGWGTGMNPTGRYKHMFEEKGEKENLSKQQPRSLRISVVVSTTDVMMNTQHNNNRCNDERTTLQLCESSIT
jgi:hypothetical protein